jgi:hypothetical protein
MRAFGNALLVILSMTLTAVFWYMAVYAIVNDGNPQAIAVCTVMGAVWAFGGLYASSLE